MNRSLKQVLAIATFVLSIFSSAQAASIDLIEVTKPDAVHVNEDVTLELRALDKDKKAVSESMSLMVRIYNGDENEVRGLELVSGKAQLNLKFEHIGVAMIQILGSNGRVLNYTNLDVVYKGGDLR